MPSSITPALRAELAPTGTLRVALNLSNFLLVTDGRAPGGPIGVAPDLGREIAARLDVPVAFVLYESPGELAAAAAQGVWDIGLIGADPLRAAEIAFSHAYIEIEASYLVRAESPIQTLAEVDRLLSGLARIMEPACIGPWLRKPNPAFEGSTPIQESELLADISSRDRL